jgi:hypothetical protein
MHAQLVSKLAAFAVAIMLNGVMILGVGYLSREQPHECAEASKTMGAAGQMPETIRV